MSGSEQAMTEQAVAVMVVGAMMLLAVGALVVAVTRRRASDE